jgi:hypothetical protein
MRKRGATLLYRDALIYVYVYAHGKTRIPWREQCLNKKMKTTGKRALHKMKPPQRRICPRPKTKTH